MLLVIVLFYHNDPMAVYSYFVKMAKLIIINSAGKHIIIHTIVINDELHREKNLKSCKTGMRGIVVDCPLIISNNRSKEQNSCYREN